MVAETLGWDMVAVTDVQTAGRVDRGRHPPDEHKDVSVLAIGKQEKSTWVRTWNSVLFVLPNTFLPKLVEV